MADTSEMPKPDPHIPGHGIVLQEQQRLAGWRQQRHRSEAPWSGIALSGGGIRSATFCLGVLQALAARDLLKQFDYMSTVSGGGFIGASLQWWWSDKHGTSEKQPVETSGTFDLLRPATWRRDSGTGDADGDAGRLVAFGTGPKDFPYGTADPDPGRRGIADSVIQQNNLAFLRNHGNYLAPGNGINIWSGVGVVLRAVLLNLLVWIPVTAAVFWALWLLSDRLPGSWLALLPHPVPTSIIEAGWLSADRSVATLPALFALILWFCVALIVLFVAASVIYSMQTWGARDDSFFGFKSSQVQRLAFGLLVVMVASLGFVYSQSLVIKSIACGFALLGAAIFFKAIAVVFGKQDHSQGYLLRRSFERWVGRSFKWFLLALAVAVVPIASAWVTTPEGAGMGLLAVTAGVASALWGHYQILNKLMPGIAARVMLPLSSALFLFGIMVLGYQIAMIFEDPGLVSDGSETAHDAVRLVIACCFAVAVLTGLCVNSNHISLSRFYRDRLAEAYLPRAQAVRDGVVARTPVADRWRLEHLWPTAPEGPHRAGPYPLINTNVVLVNDPERKYRLRGGDSFVLSPLFCGSSATEWFATSSGGLHDITVPSAMAASGAAANPNAGYVGTGPTRERLLSIVMTLLSVRLGYWIPNPRHTYHRFDKPNHLIPGAWYSLFKDGFRHDSRFLELSDGGHFDNLGVYELVRRKCRLIVVVDGEADKETSYAALVSVQRRIEEDFNATILLTPGEGPELLVARADMAYPSGARMADQPYFVARLRYNDGSHGTIIYMKATMIDDLSFKVKGYKGAHPDFPHESTADQFFDPEQFEAYRELGYRTAMRVSEDLRLNRRTINDPGKIDSLSMAAVRVKKIKSDAGKAAALAGDRKR